MVNVLTCFFFPFSFSLFSLVFYIVLTGGLSSMWKEVGNNLWKGYYKHQVVSLDYLHLGTTNYLLNYNPSSIIKESGRYVNGSYFCRYESGEKLSPAHEKTIMERLLPYHPEYEKKIGCGIDYITVHFSLSSLPLSLNSSLYKCYTWIIKL